MLFSLRTNRPRNVNWLRAAAMLYGDWGTSKAYVLGLAFAIATYSSFWLILAVSILTMLVAMNYMIICKYYPSGGGVYASARRRSEALSLVGAFFLIADYLVTASLSSLSSFNYLGVTHPETWAVAAILFIGFLNFWGPKHTGTLALLVSIPTVTVVVILGILSIPFLPRAIYDTQPLHGDIWTISKNFVSIIVALSGIEAIANITGVMKLNEGCDLKNPCVTNTSTPAILWVMLEVCFFTTLFGLAMNALPGLTVQDGTVDAPGYPNVRDSMLRYMGTVFGTAHFGPAWGTAFGWVLGIFFAILLLSAVNTGIVALTSLLFVMSRDREMPRFFQLLNRHGVPYFSLITATICSLLLIIFVNDVAGLADLYAVGFVGAIATNLGATSTDLTLNLTRKERIFMFATFIVMAVIELILLADKPHARRFAIAIMAAGLFLRTLAAERYHKRIDLRKKIIRHGEGMIEEDTTPLQEGAILCAVSTVGKTLDFALQESKKYRQPLYLLFVREQKVLTDEDRNRSWLEDEDACRIFDYAKESAHEASIHFHYVVSDSTADSIVQIGKQLRISRMILGMSRRSPFFRFLRGNLIQDVRKNLPAEIDLLVLC